MSSPDRCPPRRIVSAYLRTALSVVELTLECGHVVDWLDTSLGQKDSEHRRCPTCEPEQPEDS